MGREKMRIAIITMWFNEEDLAPFFLKHYGYVDKIFLLLDRDTNDGTGRLLKNCANVEKRDFTFPEGFDDITKIERINETVRELKGEFDWIYAVDADEFIFPPKEYQHAKEFLAREEEQGFNLVRAKIWQVYRHISDSDLDPTKPVVAQRQHGDPDLNSRFNSYYANKPIAVKTETNILWEPGCHTIRSGSIKEAKEMFYGAHWAMADRDIAIKRRIYGRKLRLSKRQIERGLTWQHINVTEDGIREEIEKHKYEPNVLGPLL